MVADLDLGDVTTRSPQDPVRLDVTQVIWAGAAVITEQMAAPIITMGHQLDESIQSNSFQQSHTFQI